MTTPTLANASKGGKRKNGEGLAVGGATLQSDPTRFESAIQCDSYVTTWIQRLIDDV